MKRKAPLPGSYTGTVDGNNAIITVTHDNVNAYWFTFWRGEWRIKQDAWDITNGQFTPTYDRQPINVRIASTSRRTAD